MLGSQANELDWENMTNKKLHDKFQHMMGEHVLNKFGEAVNRTDGFEKTFDTKMEAKFNELLMHLPPPVAPQQQQQPTPPHRNPNHSAKVKRIPSKKAKFLVALLLLLCGGGGGAA